MVDQAATPPYRLVPNVGAGEPAVYSDLGVLGTSQPGTHPQYTDGTAHRMDPRFSILTSPIGYAASNFSANPLFVEEYLNGDRGQTIQMPETTTSLATAPAFDEGGNFIDVRFGPITLRKRPCPATGTCLNGDYHLRQGSPAVNAGTNAIPAIGFNAPNMDFDAQDRPRPAASNVDIGADERAAGANP
jgi:hypothetical protein